MNVQFEDLTEEQALVWLRHNDPEFQWSEDMEDLVGVVGDDLYDYGLRSQEGSPIIIQDGQCSYRGAVGMYDMNDPNDPFD